MTLDVSMIQYYLAHAFIFNFNEVTMKVSLNDRTTEKVHQLLNVFPEGTKLTHVINVALTELHSKLVPTIEENHNDSTNQRNKQEIT